MVPADRLLRTMHGMILLEVLDHVLVRLVLCIHTRLGAVHGQCECIQNVERVRLSTHGALHEAHHLVRAAEPRVEDHLHQGHHRDAHAPKEVRVGAPWRLA